VPVVLREPWTAALYTGPEIQGQSGGSSVISPATVSAYVTRALCGCLSLLRALDDDCDLILQSPHMGDR
jgi:hypothetical protein